MTVKEVLKVDIEALSNLRIPVKEEEISRVAKGVLNDLIACYNAIEHEEAEQAKKEAIKPEDPEAQEDDTVVDLFGERNPEKEGQE